MNVLRVKIFLILMTFSLAGCSAVTAFAKETGVNMTASPSDIPVQFSGSTHHSGTPVDPAKAGMDDYDSATPSDAVESGLWDLPDPMINVLDNDGETFGFILRKLGDKGLLEGACFRLYYTYEDAARDENPIYFLTDETWSLYDFYDGGGYQDDRGLTCDIFAGTSYISGLMPGVYYLTETAAPSGYQKLPYIFLIEIEDEGDVYWGNESSGSELEETSEGIITIYNRAGAVAMPGTGGTGTWPFYLAGLLCIAVSLFMAFHMKKRRR